MGESRNPRFRQDFQSLAWDHLGPSGESGLKRVIYLCFLRDFNIGSIDILSGLILMLFGSIFGDIEWWKSSATDIPATTGTVMIAVLPIILGVQFLLNFIAFDIVNEPTIPLQKITKWSASKCDDRLNTTGQREGDPGTDATPSHGRHYITIPKIGAQVLKRLLDITNPNTGN